MRRLGRLSASLCAKPSRASEVRDQWRSSDARPAVSRRRFPHKVDISVPASAVAGLRLRRERTRRGEFFDGTSQCSCKLTSKPSISFKKTAERVRNLNLCTPTRLAKVAYVCALPCWEFGVKRSLETGGRQASDDDFDEVCI